MAKSYFSYIFGSKLNSMQYLLNGPKLIML